MKLSVSAWSFHAPLYAGKLRQTDVPAKVATLGFRHVELLEMFLWRRPPGLLQRALHRAAPQAAPAVDYSRQTLDELRGARLRAGTALVCWTIDTDLAAADPDTHRAELSHISTALEAARFLGAPLVRLMTGGQPGDAAGIGRVVETLRSVLPVAMMGKIKLAIENHFGLSADPRALIEIVQALNSPQVGVCLDLGNFEPGQAEEVIHLLAPHAIHVHCKSYAFGPDGSESKIDYPAALAALRAAGYDGTLSIEFEGDGDPAEGIRKTRALVEKYWAA